MNFLVRIAFLFLLSVLSISCDQMNCKDGGSRNDLAPIEKRFDLIDTLPAINVSLDSFFTPAKLNMKSIKIVSYIDGGCFSCAEEFLRWKKVVKSFSGYDVEFFIFFHTQDIEQFKPYLRRWRLNFSIIIDQNNSFSIKNNISPDKGFRTFLLDRDNKALASGSPIDNPYIDSLYKRIIDKTTMSFNDI